MRNLLLATLMLVAFVVTFGVSRAGAFGQGPSVGGFKAVATDDPEVLAAAEFAVKDAGKNDNTIIALNSVIAAERQTVAGANYRLCIEVDIEGVGQNVKVLVFKSLKREYQLKSWEVEDCAGNE